MYIQLAAKPVGGEVCLGSLASGARPSPPVDVVCCSVLQFDAVCCSLLQCVAVCRSVLQCSC